jgi:hypothetical protein
MTPLLVALLQGIIAEAPGLVGQVIAILHKQGKVTAEEIATFISSFDPGGGASFFTPKP